MKKTVKADLNAQSSEHSADEYTYRHGDRRSCYYGVSDKYISFAEATAFVDRRQ